MPDQLVPSSRQPRTDFLKIWGPVILLTLIGFAIALRFAGAPPPDSIRIGTGSPGGEYAVAGEHFAAALRKAGIEPILVSSAGSTENLARLRGGELDLALVQGGMAHEEEHELAGIASLYLEPLWVFTRSGSTRLDELEGKRVQIGSPGSGTRALVDRLLEEAGIDTNSFQALEDPPAAAASSLLEGGADVVCLVAGSRSETIRSLLRSEGAVPANLERADGISRNLTFLESVEIAAGAVDLAEELPRVPIRTVAPAATLVGHEDLHPAVVSLLIEAAKIRYGGRGVVEDAGQFPSLELLDIEPGLAARKAIEEGPSFLFRVLPFQLAAVIDRLKILLLPLLTLLIPLFRVAPPLYRWRIRRRILVWYQRILDFEKRLREGDLSPEELREAIQELDQFDNEVASVKVPVGHADELYQLRSHLRMVREDIQHGHGRWAHAAES